MREGKRGAVIPNKAAARHYSHVVPRSMPMTVPSFSSSAACAIAAHASARAVVRLVVCF